MAQLEARRRISPSRRCGLLLRRLCARISGLGCIRMSRDGSVDIMAVCIGVSVVAWVSQHVSDNRQTVTYAFEPNLGMTRKCGRLLFDQPEEREVRIKTTPYHTIPWAQSSWWCTHSGFRSMHWRRDYCRSWNATSTQWPTPRCSRWCWRTHSRPCAAVASTRVCVCKDGDRSASECASEWREVHDLMMVSMQEHDRTRNFANKHIARTCK